MFHSSSLQSTSNPIDVRRVRFARGYIVLPVLILLTGCVPRTESDVVVYSALDQEFASPILAAFKRSTGDVTTVVPKFDTESTKTIGLVSQIIAEQDKPVCDLFWNNEIMHTVRLQKLGLLEPRKWNVDASWPADMIASDNTWCGFAARARVLIVNTKLIPQTDEYPSSVAQLADPKWSENCAMARPLFGTTATHFAVLRAKNGRDETIEFLKQIRENAMILPGNKQVALAVSAGQIAWGLTDTDDAIIERDLGRPVAIVFPDQGSDQPGTLRIPNTIAVLKRAPHPMAANLLADFLVRPETEDRLAMGDSSQLPLSRQSKFRPRVLPDHSVRWMRADFESAADGWQEWAGELRALLSE